MTYSVSEIVLVYVDFDNLEPYVILESISTEYDSCLVHKDLLKGSEYYLQNAYLNAVAVRQLKSILGYYCLNLRTLEREFVWNIKIKGPLCQ